MHLINIPSERNDQASVEAPAIYQRLTPRDEHELEPEQRLLFPVVQQTAYMFRSTMFDVWT